MIPLRQEFASDNTAGICPEAAAALAQANTGSAPSYGDDEWTRRLCDEVRDLFEIDCDVFLVFNGTAANALALAQLCQPFHSIICHENAHIENDECGACEFYTGGSKLIPTRGADGKLDLCEVEAALLRQHELHSHKPRVISLTQVTELGTVYTAGEIRKISAFAKERRMLLHMDGARFANAVAALRCAPREITWQAGVNALSFGGTKNGLAAGELVVFFKKQQSADFDYRAKQGGHLASKMRFLAAPWLALLENNIWLKNAQRANDTALRLADGLRGCGVEIVFPVESNAVFVRLDATIARRLRELGWDFYKFIEPDVYRLMCAWSANDEAITALLSDYGSCESSVR
ncbi:MAG TPA: low specificity L-threonine aldolase [Chthoniobacterales bacterium]|nr:low specificity L-threonine aldolase [Chthoniobacterales bacterium]